MSQLALPCDLTAERSVLGACLLDRDAIVAVSRLSPDAFYLERHRLIWAAIQRCYERRTPPDIHTVATALREAGQLDVVGGVSALADLAAEVPTAVHVDYYAQAVERHANARALIEASGQIGLIGYERAAADPADAFDAAERLLFAVTQRAQSGELVTAGGLASEVFAHISSVEPPALSTGLSDLDRRLIGWRPGRLYVVAARPGMGKTGFALTTLSAAGATGARCLLFSLEMDRVEVGMRLVAGLTGISAQAIEARALGEEQLARVAGALGVVEQWPLLVSDLPGEHIAAIKGKARRAHAESPLDLIVVDYLQLAEADGEGRVQVVGAVVRGLKNLARELRVPVVALAQINRNVEGRASKVPMLSDLRESGEIEQAADSVLFLHRPDYYDAEDSPGVTELIIAKNRNGPLASLPFRFEAHTTMLRPLSRYDAPEGY